MSIPPMRPPNNELDLTDTIAAQGVLRPPCLLSASAAQLGVRRAITSDAAPVREQRQPSQHPFAKFEPYRHHSAKIVVTT